MIARVGRCKIHRRVLGFINHVKHKYQTSAHSVKKLKEAIGSPGGLEQLKHIVEIQRRFDREVGIGKAAISMRFCRISTADGIETE